MASYKQFMKHAPPDFRVFKEFGHGYLWSAERATEAAISAYYEARSSIHDEPEQSAESLNMPEEDIVAMYAEWTIADDLLKRLDRMDPAEREQHLKLDEEPDLEITFELVRQKHADLYGRIIAWEEDKEEDLLTHLNQQLKRRLDTWGHVLEFAKKTDFDDPGEPFEDVDDYCHERTILEYVAMGIVAARIRDPERLKDLPYFDTFCKHRMASDKLFRTLLKGRYSYAPWALPKNDFWWHHPPQISKKGSGKKQR